MQTTQAYLRPKEEDPETGLYRGEMTLLPSRQKHSYWSSRPYKTGLYNVDYRITTKEVKGGHETSIYNIEEASAQFPNTVRTYERLIKDITSHGRKILRQLPTACSAADIRRHIQDPDWLKEITGIGPVTAERLATKFGRLCPANDQIYQAFQEYGINIKPDSSSAKWAIVYFEAYPEELDIFRDNPYHLLQITNTAFKRVRLLKAEEPDLSLTPYSLAHIEKGLFKEHKDTWKESKQRAVAYIMQAFERITNEGHTVATRSQLVDQMHRLGFTHFIDEKGYRARVSETTIHELVYKNGYLTGTSYVDQTTSSFEPGYSSWEHTVKARKVYKSLRDLSFEPLPYTEMLIETMISDALNSVPFEFDDFQRAAIQHAFTCCASAITGPAGSGKTTVVRAILSGISRLLQAGIYTDPVTQEESRRTAFDMYITAPTGKAVDRLKEGLQVIHPETKEVIQPTNIHKGNMERSDMAPPVKFKREGNVYIDTLHSFLGFNSHSFNTPRPHPAIIIVDEASMIDTFLMCEVAYFVQQCLENEIPAFVLLTGDIEQLPPVEPGYPFRDILGSEIGSMIPATRLQKVHRQGTGSAILHNVHRILDGKLPLDAYEVEEESSISNDCMWYNYPHLQEGQQLDIWKQVELIAEDANYFTEGPEVYPEDVEIVLPLRNPSKVEPEALCIRDVNIEMQEIQAAHNGHTINKYFAQSERSGNNFMQYFAVGDRVIHTGPNGYGKTWKAQRGAVGYIDSLPRSDEGPIRVAYPDGDNEHVLEYTTPTQKGYLDLAYAHTGHTAQGSQFEVVLVVIPRVGAAPLLHRAWLYTACTRASRFLGIIATEQRLQQCVDMDSKRMRQTALSKHTTEV